ncbi:MAG: hypothetical protein HYZ11_09470 [Candidatus Tectomicrobia bacterium]|uniref:Surface antigen domain-containing protein n=1 Tax=Tectimicrobiota bacterium TaxID=2528274 RepID=A0A932I0S9_UNCTE|nr:hypothetical protein [Candidatus Tectomicrobia bacterium]
MRAILRRIRSRLPAGARAAALLLAAFLLGACAAATAEGPARPPLAPKDRELMAGATQEALEKNPVGQGVNWTNPETGRRGTTTPIRTFRTQTDEPCRDYQMTMTRENQTEFAYYSACRNKEGQWVNRGRLGLAGNYFEPAPPGYVYGRPDLPPPPWYGHPYYYDPWYDPWYPHRYYGPGFHGRFLYRRRLLHRR